MLEQLSGEKNISREWKKWDYREADDFYDREGTRGTDKLVKCTEEERKAYGDVFARSEQSSFGIRDRLERLSNETEEDKKRKNLEAEIEKLKEELEKIRVVERIAILKHKAGEILDRLREIATTIMIDHAPEDTDESRKSEKQIQESAKQILDGLEKEIKYLYDFIHS